MSNETSIAINNWIDVHVNDTCPYTKYIVQLSKEKEQLFNDTTPFPKLFLNLEPFTEYKVIILSGKTSIINKFVRTLEGGKR